MGAADPDCLFCKIVAGEIPSTRVDEDDRTVTFMDINPATRGHVLVVPRRTRGICSRSIPRTSPRSRGRASGSRGRCPSGWGPTG